MEKINPDTVTITVDGKTYKRKYNGSSCRGCSFAKPYGDGEDICTMDEPLRDSINCGSSIWVEADENKHEIKIPEGCEVDSITTEGGSVVVTFKQKEPQLPKTWEEFCEMNPVDCEYYITNLDGVSKFCPIGDRKKRREYEDRNLLPDRATAEAVLALCQLIQLRECYNQGWVPNWSDLKEAKYIIMFVDNKIDKDIAASCVDSPLYFKTKELRDLFLENFSDLIEKTRPLYGIKEGGEE